MRAVESTSPPTTDVQAAYERVLSALLGTLQARIECGPEG